MESSSPNGEHSRDRIKQHKQQVFKMVNGESVEYGEKVGIILTTENKFQFSDLQESSCVNLMK